MCVIIHVDAKQTVEKKLLQNCYDNNRDGWGIMWAQDGKVHGLKELSDFDSFYKAWMSVPRSTMRGIHFRIKTHGLRNKDNCHPFLVGDKLSVMHNGVINTAAIEEDMSDTHNFVKYELAPILTGWEDFMHDPDLVKLLDDITGNSKLLLINGEGEAVRTRENMWHKHEGIYYSNQHSLTAPYRASSSHTYSKRDSSWGDWDGDMGSNCDLPNDRFRGNVHKHNTNHSNHIIGPVNNTSRTTGVASGAVITPHKSSMEQIQDNKSYQTWWEQRHNKPWSERTAPGINKKREEAEPVLDETNVVSDLYSGNKTDAEGQAFVERKSQEQEQAEDMAIEEAEERAAMLRALGLEEEIEGQQSEFPPASDTEFEEVEEEDDEVELIYDIEQLSSMTFEDMLDAVREYPRSVAYTMKGLADICLSAGIFKIISEEKPEDLKKVNS